MTDGLNDSTLTPNTDRDNGIVRVHSCRCLATASAAERSDVT